MASSPEGQGGPGSQWSGHRLAPLPLGQSWLRGGERRPPQPRQPSPPDGTPATTGQPWAFETWDEPGTVLTRQAVRPATTAPATSPWRALIVLGLLGLAAILTIVIASRADPVKEPAPLPEAPSHVITALTRSHPTEVRARVGEYVRFALPDGRTYTTVIEQTSASTPPVSALNLPGQQPQLRADSVGRALVEVLAEPTCPDPESCPDRRTLLGAVQIVVTG